jgi:hypothetical protein
MGGIEAGCDVCGDEAHWYHGCRDRHCPQCQAHATRRWAERQQLMMLPVRYFHVVFTLPHDLNGWVELHPDVLYRLLFKAVWGTLERFGRDPKRLGGQLGMSAVLHTWGQNLSRHVHLHCLVPGGALGDDGRWHAARSSYLFPVQALSRHFRGTMVRLLRQAADQGRLRRVARPGEVDRLLDRLMAMEWVVYSKHCLEHAASVVEYLARYTHRIAISDARIVRVDADSVTLRYKAYADQGRRKTMTLEGQEFARRFLMHIVPKGLMRVRHYGFLANCCRTRKLACVRAALAADDEPGDRKQRRSLPVDWTCRACGKGRLTVRRRLPAIRSRPWRSGPPG